MSTSQLYHFDNKLKINKQPCCWCLNAFGHDVKDFKYSKIEGKDVRMCERCNEGIEMVNNPKYWVFMAFAVKKIFHYKDIQKYVWSYFYRLIPEEVLNKLESKFIALFPITENPLYMPHYCEFCGEEKSEVRGISYKPNKKKEYFTVGCCKKCLNRDEAMICKEYKRFDSPKAREIMLELARERIRECLVCHGSSMMRSTSFLPVKTVVPCILCHVKIDWPEGQINVEEN